MIRVLAVALALAVSAAGLQSWRLANEQADHENTKTQHAEKVAAMERAAKKAVDDARAEEQRRTAEVQKAADEAHDQLANARADAAASADAGQRLRAQLAALTARCRAASGNSAASKGGAPADATADLLADVQRRLDEAADGIARFADEAHVAGRACERISDKVRSAADPAALHR